MQANQQRDQGPVASDQAVDQPRLAPSERAFVLEVYRAGIASPSLNDAWREADLLLASELKTLRNSIHPDASSAPRPGRRGRPGRVGAYLVEEHQADGVHWIVSLLAPNTGNAIDFGSHRQLAERVLDTIHQHLPPSAFRDPPSSKPELTLDESAADAPAVEDVDEPVSGSYL